MKEVLLSLDWNAIIGYGLPIVAVVMGGFLAKFKKKVKAASELLSSFSNAIEDDNIDANERKDLVEKAKLFLGVTTEETK